MNLAQWHITRGFSSVIPAEAGIQVFIPAQAGIYIVFWIPVFTGKYWIPAYAGMTVDKTDVLPHSETIFDFCHV